MKPLAGLRVLELATEIAGPYAAKLLCDAGAEVVKLEPPEGDAMRRFTASAQALAPDEIPAAVSRTQAHSPGVSHTGAGRVSLLSASRCPWQVNGV